MISPRLVLPALSYVEVSMPKQGGDLKEYLLTKKAFRWQWRDVFYYICMKKIRLFSKRTVL